MLVEDLRFRYHAASSSARAWTIDSVSLDVAPGEILGIVGPNGSGKSSLLKLMAGLLTPESGAVRLEGRPLAASVPAEVAKVVAVVPQESVAVFPFTVAETVMMGRYVHQVPSSWSLGIGDLSSHDCAVSLQAMADTGILPLADRPLSDLSGGERQRVLLARALAQEPRILLLDEPTAFLDVHHQLELCALVVRLRRERGLTVILVSHDLNVAGQYCDRLLLLEQGRPVRLGPPNEVIRPEVLRGVYRCEVMVDAHPQSGRPRVTLPHVAG